MEIDSAGGLGEREIAAARQGADELRALVEDARRRSCAVLVETQGGRVELTADMLDSIVKVVEAATAGSGSGIEAEMSPQEAAGILRMSRPSVMRLIERRHLHARMVGSHHRLSRAEILAYKDRQTRVRRDALANLTSLAEESDF